MNTQTRATEEDFAALRKRLNALPYRPTDAWRMANSFIRDGALYLVWNKSTQEVNEMYEAACRALAAAEREEAANKPV